MPLTGHNLLAAARLADGSAKTGDPHLSYNCREHLIAKVRLALCAAGTIQAPARLWRSRGSAFFRAAPKALPTKTASKALATPRQGTIGSRRRGPGALKVLTWCPFRERLVHAQLHVVTCSPGLCTAAGCCRPAHGCGQHMTPQSACGCFLAAAAVEDPSGSGAEGATAAALRSAGGSSGGRGTRSGQPAVQPSAQASARPCRVRSESVSLGARGGTLLNLGATHRAQQEVASRVAATFTSGYYYRSTCFQVR